MNAPHMAGESPDDVPAENTDQAWLARLRATLRHSPARVLPCARRAAVACVLRPSPPPLSSSSSGLQLLFIVRAAHPGDPWSGDVAWPGGRVEPGETDLQAAVREAEEEVGLRLTSAGGFELLGALDDRPAVRKKGVATLVVRAFVFLQTTPHTPPLVLQAKEVSAAWWVPLSTLTADCPARLPFFAVPITRLSTRIAILRNRRVCALLRIIGLDFALFPFIALPTPPDSPGPMRLWGVTLGLCELLCTAARDGAAQGLVLRVPRWRMRHVLWDALLWLAWRTDPNSWT